MLEVIQRLPRKIWKVSRTRAILISHATDTILADASKVSSQIKNDLPGKEKEAEKKGEAFASQAGQKFDQAVRISRLFVCHRQRC